MHKENDVTVANLNFAEKHNQKTMAMFAIFQAGYFIHLDNIAFDAIDPKYYKTLLHSCFRRDYSTVTDLYGGDVKNLILGAEIYIRSCGMDSAQQLYTPEEIQEALQIKAIQVPYIIKLSRRIFKNPQALADLEDLIALVDAKSTQIAIDSGSMQQIISTRFEELIKSNNIKGSLMSRFVISDNVMRVVGAKSKARVYCSLFAGVRAAYIWEQLGGSRLFDMYWPRSMAKSMRVYVAMSG